MRKTIFILSVLFVSTVLNAQDVKKAKIEFEKQTIDLGRFEQDNSIHHCQFIFKNTGDEKLYIHRVMPSCSCTNAKYPTNAIAPGASDTIFITYDGSKKSANKFRTSVVIHSNAVNEMTKVYIKGEKLPAKVVETPEIQIED